MLFRNLKIQWNNKGRIWVKNDKENKRTWSGYLSDKEKEYSNEKKVNAIPVYNGYGRSWNCMFAACPD